jgi:hypothetical protein
MFNFKFSSGKVIITAKSGHICRVYIKATILLKLKKTLQVHYIKQKSLINK